MSSDALAPIRIGAISADSLNRGCTCRSLDPKRLRRELEGEPFLAGLADEIARTRPHLFSSIAVFVSHAQYERMAAIVAAVEQVIAIPAYRYPAPGDTLKRFCTPVARRPDDR